ncbi:MAG: hypothetical protein HYZ44_04780 [Bacteroidetes bacterium]|nr:hypothetical protein [Bacteroidota bacterium]
MQDLRITIVQADLHWEDIGANLASFEEKIWGIGPTDVIILPEMFTTGFTMQAGRLAEMMNMRTFKWMRQMADQTGALILGSFIANVHDRYYNRLLWNLKFSKKLKGCRFRSTTELVCASRRFNKSLF